MKKYCFLLLITLTFSLEIKAQMSTYYDALYLNQKMDTDLHKIILSKDIKQLLMPYYPDVDINEINETLLNKNPFLIDLFVTQAGMAEGDNYFAKSISGIGGLDVTNFSKGLSLFLIDRSREELTIAFFEKFKKCLDKNKELRILFPNTSDRIVNLLGYQYSEMLPELQKAFKKDMELLPENLIEVLLLPDYYEVFKDVPGFIIVLNSYTLMKQITVLSPTQIIDSLPNIAVSEGNRIIDTNLYNIFKLSSIFSNSIRKNNTTRNWISFSEFNNTVLKNSICFNLYLGLFYQQIKNENIEINGKNLAELIQSKDNLILFYKNQLSKLLFLTEKIDTAYIEINALKKDGRKLDNENIVSYLNTTIELSEFGYNFLRFIKNDTDNFNIKYITLAKETNSLYLNTFIGEYNLAIHNAINILNTINGLIKSKPIDEKLINDISTYGIFIANIADSKNPDDVKIAINNAALPSGSSSYKKYHYWNLSINGYLGANYNFHTSSSANDTWKNSFNLTVPVGFNLSLFSIGKGGAISAFIPVIDVGAIAYYQLSEDSTTVDQKIYLRNIFSPGAYIVYGFGGNWPMSLGAGGQYGPGLYKIGEDLINPTWRWNVFLTVDIPIFNLTKGRKISK